MNWSPNVWLRRFQRAVSAQDFVKVRALRADVFYDTVELVREGGYTTASGARVDLRIHEAEMLAGSHLYSRPFVATPQGPSVRTAIYADNSDCLLTAARLIGQGLHPAVLNLANRQHPGGGVFGRNSWDKESNCWDTFVAL